MTQFDTIFAGVRPVTDGVMGTSIAYKAPDADSVTVTAIIGAVTADEEEIPDGRDRRQRRSVVIGRDPDAEGGGVAEIREDATIDIGSDRWSIEAIEAKTGTYTRVRVVRIGAVERSRAGYRGRG